MSYTVKQLASMYHTTRQTIHTKLKHPDMSSYITRQDDKLIIDPAGLNIFNTIMSQSKVALHQNDSSTQSSISQVDGVNYQDLYVKELLKQIESLQQESSRLKEQNDKLIAGLLDVQKMLPAPDQKKKKFWIF